jgi:hypothetical protein
MRLFCSLEYLEFCVARDAWLINPSGIAFNRGCDIFIAEAGTCLIRKVGGNGLLTTAAGTGKCGVSQPASPNTTQDLAPPAGIVADRLKRSGYGDARVVAN